MPWTPRTIFVVIVHGPYKSVELEVMCTWAISFLSTNPTSDIGKSHLTCTPSNK